MNEKHAFLVAGTQSGCGKTTLTLGLLASLRERGMRVQPFKVGPDFIDPGFHTQVAGLESRNLDGWMLTPDYNRALFQKCLAQADVGIVEGVMGLFDGYDGRSESGSSAEMAKWLGLPVVLVVDARSMARSAAALVHGFSRFDSRLKIAGVIFNRIGGPGHLEYLKEAMSSNMPEIPVLGGVPREDPIGIPERHLGLVTADETPLSREWRERLVALVEHYVDLDLLLARTLYPQEPLFQGCEGREPPEVRGAGGEVFATQEGIPPLESPGHMVSKPDEVLIAVARDAAFCFYYPDNLELLRAAGAKIHLFSPLAGESFPEEAAGLYLGGGYPELFAEDLSRREPFLEALRRGAAQGLPIHAECGGLMVLGSFIETLEGRRYPMAGVLPFGTRMLKRRKALGYTEVVLREPCLLGEPGMILRGHEFHYSEIVEADEGVPGEAGGEGQEAGKPEAREKDRSDISPAISKSARQLRFAYELRMRKNAPARSEGYMVGSVLASYIHLHWGSAPKAPLAFAKRCRYYQAMREKGRGTPFVIDLEG